MSFRDQFPSGLRQLIYIGVWRGDACATERGGRQWMTFGRGGLIGAAGEGKEGEQGDSQRKDITEGRSEERRVGKKCTAGGTKEHRSNARGDTLSVGGGDIGARESVCVQRTS